MEKFDPGADYGPARQNFVWVCVNATPRTYTQCNTADAMAVWQAFGREIPRHGLGANTFIFNSGCMMGCHEAGTTVAILARALSPTTQVQFFRNVTVEDVVPLIQQCLLTA